tara:strand:+ start:232 stop:717 length:486 start_codon:yes stop_codon:yes gene_type:complete
MKVRDSGMPDEGTWREFFDAEAIFRTLGLYADADCVVDFGCGYGTFSIPAARLIQGSVIALDIEPEMIKLTREKTASEGLANLEALQCDFLAEGTGLPDASVDVAMLFNILHTEHIGRLLQETWRILKPSGVVAITHWNYDVTTPRGPSMEIRPRPDQCRQ